jgi:hypothetical protein
LVSGVVAGVVTSGPARSVRIRQRWCGSTRNKTNASRWTVNKIDRWAQFALLGLFLYLARTARVRGAEPGVLWRDVRVLKLGMRRVLRRELLHVLLGALWRILLRRCCWRRFAALRRRRCQRSTRHEPATIKVISFGFCTPIL